MVNTTRKDVDVFFGRLCQVSFWTIATLQSIENKTKTTKSRYSERNKQTKTSKIEHNCKVCTCHVMGWWDNRCKITAGERGITDFMLVGLYSVHHLSWGCQVRYYKYWILRNAFWLILWELCERLNRAHLKDIKRWPRDLLKGRCQLRFSKVQKLSRFFRRHKTSWKTYVETQNTCKQGDFGFAGKPVA